MAPVLALLSFGTGQPAQNLTRTEGVDTTTQKHQKYPFLPVSNGLDPGKSIWRALLANIPQANSATSLTITNYQEDRAVREAICLGIAAILPFVTQIGGNQLLSSTKLLISVGVVLDTIRQLDAQMVMRNYSGFLS